MRGVPITTDQLIRERKRCSYARVFVHVDASKPLVRSFRVHTPDGGSFIQRVVYEYEPRYCEVCKSLTHSTYLCQHSGKLKPKEAGIHIVGNFRPIACCNVIYKIILKVISNRLVLILDGIIDKAHSGFIKGRLITFT